MRFCKTWWVNSLALKILLAFIAGTTLSITFLLLFSAFVKDRLPGMGLEERTRHLATQLTFDRNDRPTGFQGDGEHPAWLYQSLSQETAFRVIDEKGEMVLASAGAARWPDSSAVNRLQPGHFEFIINDVLYKGATEAYLHNGKTGYVQLTVSSRMVGFLHQQFAVPFIQRGIIVFSLVLLVVFGFCAWFTLKYSLKPLRRASEAAAGVSPQTLGTRVQTAGVPAEVAPLINSFNQALERLAKGYRVQQDFLAQAAHELKTPLTLIRAEVELMECSWETRVPLLTHIEHIARHVQQLLLLAEASEPHSYRFDYLDPGDVARDVADFLLGIADEKSVVIVVSAPSASLNWYADRGALFTLIKNITENALQHAPAESRIVIAINAGSIAVCDSGPGVMPEHLSMLFTRFWRGAHRRDHGAGLGLAICHEIALAHNWMLSAENSNPGLKMTISL